MKNKIIDEIQKLGQSVWLDNLSRKIIDSGELKKLIEDAGVRGLTSNPAIFQQAISEADYYDKDIEKFAQEGLDSLAIYEKLAVSDIQRAADLFRPLYDSTNGGDGYVSLEVNPTLVKDTEGTIEEAHRLWNAVDRPNVMIKVPGTVEGLPAITQLIADGININVTLLFSVERYRAVTDAYMDGLQLRLDRGQPIDHVASVASFFLSRIDVLVDPLLDDIIKTNPERAEKAKFVKGEVAIANAKKAYEVFLEAFNSDRFHRLAEHGARKQRVLWASTGNKNPEYDELKYVNPLIGADTVNTMPEKTLEATLKGAKPADTVQQEMSHINKVWETLPELGISIEDVASQLEKEGVEKFDVPFNKLLNAIEEQRKAQV